MLASIILANVIVGLIGVVGAYGILTFFVKNHSKLLFLVSFAAGAMLAVSFFDLLPEALSRHGDFMVIMEFFVIGFVVFMLIEKSLLFYHCHEENCRAHSSAKLIILGDSVHNFLDGVAIGASFLAGSSIGVFTTLAIIIHEIPQEIGDFGVLIHRGYSKGRALLYNLLSAIMAVLGGVLAYFSLYSFHSYIPYVLSLTAGGFVYIAAADLIPELHNDSTSRSKISWHSAILILGIVAVWTLGRYFGE